MDDAAACYRHPDSPTRIACQRCGRPICPECMIPGSVGFQCPECVASGMRETRQHALPYGGTRVSDPKRTSYVLIAINAVVFLAVLATGGAWGRVFNWFALSPLGRCEAGDAWLNYPDPAACVAAGGAWVDGVASGAPWQVLTSAFTHAQLLHIGFNMLMVYLLGPQIEQIFGRARFLALYLVAALGGGAGVMLFSEWYTATMGASGAVYGMIGAVLLLAIKHKGDVRGILIWLGLNVVLSFTWAGISWQGHLGGLLGGLGVAAILLYLPRDKRATLQWPLIGLLALAFIGLIVWKSLSFAA